MRVKQLLFTFSFTLLVSFAFSQYRTSLGLIAGKEGYGLSFKQFVQPEQNIEVNFLYRRPGGGQLVALYQFHKEIHAPTLHTKSICWSYGIGAHAGYWKEHELGYKTGGNKSIGADGVVGFEYNFGFMPFTIGAELRPYIEYRTNTVNISQGYVDISLMLRYIIAD